MRSATCRPAVGQRHHQHGVGIGSFTADCTGANIPLSSTHGGGVNVLFCDGTVRFLAYSMPLGVLAKLATRDDGNPLPEF